MSRKKRVSFLDPTYYMSVRTEDVRSKEFDSAILNADKSEKKGTIMALERTKEANERTDWALIRTEMANRRTLMAYVRTALAIAALSRSEDSSFIAVVGIIFISMALIDYMYVYLKSHGQGEECPVTLMWLITTTAPVLVAVISIYALSLRAS